MPVNSTARFTCHTTDNYSVTWEFKSPDVNYNLVVTNSHILRHIYGYPIDLDQPYYYKAVLTVSFNEGPDQCSFNQTLFICKARVVADAAYFITSQFKVTIYGTL